MNLLGDVHAVDYGIRQLLKCQAAKIYLKRDTAIRGGMSPNFLAQAELKLRVSSPDEPELVKITLKPSSSVRILLINYKMKAQG